MPNITGFNKREVQAFLLRAGHTMAYFLITELQGWYYSRYIGPRQPGRLEDHRFKD